MKHTILLFALVALFASCNQDSGDAAMYKKQVDSLTALLGTRPAEGKRSAPVLRTNALFSNKLGQNSNGAPIDSFLIEWRQGKQAAFRWTRFLTQKGFRDSVIDSSSAYSFVIPASNLRYLLDDPSQRSEYLIVYLGVDSNYQITLVYDGAVTDFQNAENDTLYEQPVKTHNGTKYTFDNAYPCPICDKIGLSDN